MKFTTSNEVKTWLRGLALLKKDLEMKTGFYTDLMRISRQMGDAGKKHEGYYQAQVERLHQKMELLSEDIERVLDTLNPEEKAVMTARYIRRLMWDAMEFHIYYSRRQAIRIHDRAIKKLVGQEVDVRGYTGEH